ncbi:MAG: ATP-binding protein [Nitrospira sp.]|nr:ATP-binding protein [Nitrospira sp.]
MATDRLSGVDGYEGSPAPPTKVAIVGAGRGGTAMLTLLHQLRTVKVVGIADRNPEAPGLRRARELHVPVFQESDDLLRVTDPDLVIDVTGDEAMERALRQRMPAGVGILSGPSSRLLYDLVKHEFALQAELLQTDKLAGIGSFAAGIAHDINNPLQLILGLAENLTEEQDLETVHLQARDIVEAVKRTTAICRDLTSYSRRTSGRSEQVVSVNAKLDEALKIARYAVGLQDIEVRKSYWPDATAVGNPDEILHVFINLMTNAIQAMDQGGILTITTATYDGMTIVKISDTGHGIPPDIIGRIFEPFFTTKPPGKGTGLGLYNIKNVVHRMHGSIDVESHPGRGTTFTIVFPQNRVEEHGPSS